MKNRLIPIFFAGLLFAAFSPLLTSAATLYFYPQSASVVAGEDISFDLRLNTEGEIVNALTVRAFLNNRLAIINAAENSGSVIPIFVEPPKLESQTALSLTGGVPSGFEGDGIVAKVVLRALSPGRVTLAIDAGSEVYLHGDSGQKAALKILEADLEINARGKDYVPLSSLSHPDPNQWYRTQPGVMKWDLEPGVQYSYLISQDPLAVPDETADRPEGELEWQGQIKLEGLEQGIYYFALKKIGSETVSRWRLMNDATAPEWVQVELSRGTPETEGRPFVNFLATDALSGVEYYEAKFDDGEPLTITSPYPLPEHFKLLTLKAFDRAGNFTEKAVPGPDRIIWPWIALCAVIFTIGIFGIMKKRNVTE